MSELDIDELTSRACELKTVCPEATVDECVEVALWELACGDLEADVCQCPRCQEPCAGEPLRSA